MVLLQKISYSIWGTRTTLERAQNGFDEIEHITPLPMWLGFSADFEPYDADSPSDLYLFHTKVRRFYYELWGVDLVWPSSSRVQAVETKYLLEGDV